MHWSAQDGGLAGIVDLETERARWGTEAPYTVA